MATAAQHRLTPATDTTPVIVRIPEKELSGAQWANRFPGSASTNDLVSPFKENVNAFIAALKAAGASVRISATYRPKERAYLMHWAHKIGRNGTSSTKAPLMDGVNIEWTHPTDAESVRASLDMVNAYGIGVLSADTPPALETLHTSRQAIDMSISWNGELSIADVNGETTKITTEPRTGMNAQLKIVGASYGVIKFVGGERDRPHWSMTGH